MRIREPKIGEIIHCSKREEVYEMLDCLQAMGYRWADGEKMHENKRLNRILKKKKYYDGLCYEIMAGKVVLGYDLPILNIGRPADNKLVPIEFSSLVLPD